MKFLLPAKIHIVPLPPLVSQGQNRVWSATDCPLKLWFHSFWVTAIKFYSNTYLHIPKKKPPCCNHTILLPTKISWFSVKVEHTSIAIGQASFMHCGDTMAQQLSVGRGGEFLQSNSSNLPSCTSLLSAHWCYTEQWIRLTAGTARCLQYRLTSHLSNENRLGLAVKQVNSRQKAVQQQIAQI